MQIIDDNITVVIRIQIRYRSKELKEITVAVGILVNAEAVNLTLEERGFLSPVVALVNCRGLSLLASSQHFSRQDFPENASLNYFWILALFIHASPFSCRHLQCSWKYPIYLGGGGEDKKTDS